MRPFAATALPRPAAALSLPLPLLLLLLLTASCAPAPSLANIFTWSLAPPAPPLPQCPPPGFTAVPNLNLTAYTAAPWYAQLQLPISFQGEDPLQYLYCVKAEYRRLPPTDPRVQTVNRGSAAAQYLDDDEGGNGSALGAIVGGPAAAWSGGGIPVYEVLNYANRGQVNGPPVGTSLEAPDGRPLDAPLAPQELVAVPDPAAAGTPTANSMLLVGPSAYLTNLVSYNWRLGWGQYWVVAVMPSNNSRIGYDWAIVSGGPPEYSSPGGCQTTPPGPVPVGLSAASNFLSWLDTSLRSKASALDSVTRGSSRGLWLMSRKPVDTQGTSEMLKTARDLGYDTSVLVQVQQQGCNYSSPAVPISVPAPPPPPPPPPAPAPAPAQPLAQVQVRPRPLSSSKSAQAGPP